MVEDAKLEKVKEERLRKAKLIMEDNLVSNVADKQPKDLSNFKEVQAFAKFKGYKPGWAYFYGKKRGFIK